MLLIAEDAGLAPLRLAYPAPAGFAAPRRLSAGPNPAASPVLLGRSNVGGNGAGSDTDQLRLCRRDKPLGPGYGRIAGTENDGDRKLEIGLAGGFPPEPLRPIPEPNRRLLAVAGLLFTAMVVRSRSNVRTRR